MTTALRPGRSGTWQEMAPLVTVASTSLHLTDASPDSASATSPVTCSVELVVVAPLIGALSATVGGVKSRFTVTGSCVWWPTLSSARPVTVCPAPSSLNVVGGEQKVSCLVSPHAKLTSIG